jgi:hypothetical protein
MNEPKNYEEILEAKFGVVGEVMKKEINSSRFPVTFHHDYIRTLNESRSKLEKFESRGMVAMEVREQVPNIEDREEEFLKGAIGYIFHYNSQEILAEIMECPDSKLLNSYQEMLKFANTLWFNKEMV